MVSKYKLNDYEIKKNSTDDEKCLLKFSSCDENKYQLHKLSKEDLKLFISWAKLVEKLTWREIKNYQGLKFENSPNLNKPSTVPDDVILCSMRLSKKARIIGYRKNQYFYNVWFDGNHETC